MSDTDRQTDRRLEQAILELLERRAPTATICPSDAARAVYTGDGDGWRALMEPARRAARRLVAAGEVEITQAGRPVDPLPTRTPPASTTRCTASAGRVLLLLALGAFLP
ncbi:DUF3253 domain-containing protein [Streptomyces sp. NPDC048331]|uniref:DUF3253 domain-containing protein n=1 Tax=Streptomyces sp. NPDC048331 TaxID=3365534 RepID=UPI00371BC20A